MGRLDAYLLRYLSSNDFRTLTSIEMGMKNHEYVPVELCLGIADLKKGGGDKILKDLTQHGLVAYEAQGKYGISYRLTTAGYDFLALRVLTKRGTIKFFGNQIGVGKESDIYAVEDSYRNPMCLKLHRLGRSSFRQVKNKRDYHKNRSFVSWLYLSRLSATKEFAYLQTLYDCGFPVPKPIENNRHAVVMELIDGVSLWKINSLKNPAKVYYECMDIIKRLAECGLIHGDFNEFNLLIGNTDDDECEETSNEGLDDDDDDDEEEEEEGEESDGKLWVIDLPQMVSTSHANAKWYFDRDVECIISFFKKKFNYECDERPNFDDIVKKDNLDVKIKASGYKKEIATRRKGKEEENLSEIMESASLSDSDCSKETKSKNANVDEDDDDNEGGDNDDEGSDIDNEDGDNDEVNIDDEDGDNDDEVGNNDDDDDKGSTEAGKGVESEWRRAIKSELEREQLKNLRRRCRKREEKRARSKKVGRKENFKVELHKAMDKFF